MPKSISDLSPDEKKKLEEQKCTDWDALFNIQLGVAYSILLIICTATSSNVAWSALQKIFLGSAKVHAIKL